MEVSNDNTRSNSKGEEEKIKTEDSIYLEDSMISSIPDLKKNQKLSLFVFMLIEFLTTILTISLAPLYSLIAIHYKVSTGKVKILRLLTVAACILAFQPTNKLIGKYGVKRGMIICLIGGIIGCCLCCCINFNYNLFLLGFFIVQFFLQGNHSAKGTFINLYYTEKNVIFSLMLF